MVAPHLAQYTVNDQTVLVLPHSRAIRTSRDRDPASPEPWSESSSCGAMGLSGALRRGGGA